MTFTSSHCCLPCSLHAVYANAIPPRKKRWKRNKLYWTQKQRVSKVVRVVAWPGVIWQRHLRPGCWAPGRGPLTSYFSIFQRMSLHTQCVWDGVRCGQPVPIGHLGALCKKTVSCAPCWGEGEPWIPISLLPEHPERDQTRHPLFQLMIITANSRLRKRFKFQLCHLSLWTVY